MSRNYVSQGVSATDGIVITTHARKRISSRRFSLTAILATLQYGRVSHVRGAAIYVIGRKEVLRYKAEGIDLSRYEGIQVLCSTDGIIITAYRNRDFRELRLSGRGRL